MSEGLESRRHACQKERNECYKQSEAEGRISVGGWGWGGLGKLFSHMKANLCEVMSPAEATATYNFRRAGCKGKGSPQLEGILHPKEAAQPQERHLNNKDQQQQVV